jgi:LL-diaminopimelate aminotransferase
MNIEFSEKALYFKPNIFNILQEEMEKQQKKGVKTINFSVGTPDFPPAPHVIDAVLEAASDPDNYKYSLADTAELKSAVADWYKDRYGVTLNADEIMSVNGSQEGLAHIAMTVCNPGDVVLAPNPGYPIFGVGPYLNDADVHYYELKAENHFEPDLNDIDEELALRAKMMVVSYPLNPTCTCASMDFYEKLVAFANKYNILIVHDNAYSEIEYDGRKGFSFLAVPGAKDVGVEFNSLSKTYNLTGLRISFCVGNSEVIKRFSTIRSQFDYGVSYIVQKAAIAALKGPQSGVLSQQRLYQVRRDALCGGLRSIGWDVPYSEGTMFVWAPIPKGYTSSEKFCLDMLSNTGVLCTPGSAFGSNGEGFVRFALVHPENVIDEAVGKIKKWFENILT